MASLTIDSSFFIGDINIPNTGSTAIAQGLTQAIARYQKECLMGIFGYPLYKAFIADDLTAGRMKDLKDGAEYTDALGRLKKFEGLIHDTNISLIAFYVYYFFQEQSATLTTGVSTKVANSEGGKSVSPMEKMVSAWNHFSRETQSLIEFLWFKVDCSGARVYPEFDTCQYWEARSFSDSINIFNI